MNRFLLRIFLGLGLLLSLTGASLAVDAKPASQSPELAALLAILKDDVARARLVEQLSQVTNATAPKTEARLYGPPAPKNLQDRLNEPADSSLARELGLYTQNMARDAVDLATKIWRGLVNFAHLIDGSVDLDWTRIQTELQSIVSAAAIAFAIWFGGRWVLRWPFGMINRAAEGRSALIRGLMLVGVVIAETLLLAVAWTAAVTFLVTYSPGNRIGLLDSLFVNAFVLIELIKTTLRALLQPRQRHLRLLPVSDETARGLSFWLTLLVGWIGYGVLLIFPIVNATIGFAVGLGVRLVIVLTGLIAAVTLILVRKVPVRDAMAAAAARFNGGALSVVFMMLAHAWHMILISYLLLTFAIWVTRPFDAVSFMARATLETVIIVAIGAGLTALIGRSIDQGIKLPDDIKRIIPRLEERLNLLIPSFLRLIRFMILIGVAVGVFQAWSLIDLPAWIDSAGGTELLTRIISALVIVLIAMFIWIATTSWFEFRLNPATGRVSTARARTLFSLFRNAFSILLAVVAAMLVLSQIGIDIAPLIAGAGIIGVAIGFGSQKLVQDIITGAFIQFENAMNEGDVVTVAGISGVVDRLTIRSVGIRDVNGVYHVIPFSSVGSVSNAMRGFAFHVADAVVAYSSDVEKVKRLMQEAFDQLLKTEHGASILEALEMNGITEFQNNSMIIRARIKTLPGEQWNVGRAYNEKLKAIFDENGVTMPFQQATVWIGQDGRPMHPEAEMMRQSTALEREEPAPVTEKRRRKPRETIDVPDRLDKKDEDEDGDDDGR